MSLEKKVEHRGFIADIVYGIFEPGANTSTIVFMNIALIFLIIVEISIIFMGFNNIHAYIFLFLTVCLFILMQIFLYLLHNNNNDDIKKNK